MNDACCSYEKGHWRYYKNPKNNITIIQMYDEDNYSYKTAEEKIIILDHTTMTHIIHFIVFFVIEDIYNYICTYLQNLIYIVSKHVTSMTL